MIDGTPVTTNIVTKASGSHTLIESIREMDLDTVRSIYALDIVSFDIESPLQHVGLEAKRKNWANVFSMFERPLDGNKTEAGFDRAAPPLA